MFGQIIGWAIMISILLILPAGWLSLLLFIPKAFLRDKSAMFYRIVDKSQLCCYGVFLLTVFLILALYSVYFIVEGFSNLPRVPMPVW